MSPSLGRSVPWGSGTSCFGAGCSAQRVCKAPQPRTKPPNPPSRSPAHSLPPSPLSLLALLWHHTLAVLSAAAGQQVPSAQRYKKLHCALKVPGGRVGVPGGDGCLGAG